MIPERLKRLFSRTPRAADVPAGTSEVKEPEVSFNVPQVYEVTADYPCCTDPDMPFASLNPIQSCFKQHYNPNISCVVESPTGTGKSALIYIAARCFLDQGQIVVLTAPTKELVKSLYKEASGIWGSKIVGLNTGFDKNTDGKFFIVTTPEGYISAVRSSKPWTKAGLLIADEAHKICDPSRGGDLDVAIALQIMNGGKALLISGTFSFKREIASLLNADLFISKYRRTVINVKEVHAPDDIDAVEAPKKLPPGVKPTLSGHVFNRDSVRLRLLKQELANRAGESILLFVTTKNVGNCLSEALVAPFHNGDIAEKEKDRLVAEFRAGTIKVLIATDTLAEGVNTPADSVMIFGTRRGGYYLDKSDFEQRGGRGGRNRDSTDVVLFGDKIEIFHAKKENLAKSLPLPVESMVLTMLSLNSATTDELVMALGKTYAATLTEPQKIRETVERYIRFIKACNILQQREGGYYTLTQEGALLAHFYLSPRAYISYIVTARKLAASELLPVDKGCVLLSTILPVPRVEVPSRIEKDFHMRLIASDLDKEVSYHKAAVLKYFLHNYSNMPPYFGYQLRDAERWLTMFSDMERYSVHKNGAPGKEWLSLAVCGLKTSAAKASAKNKTKKAAKPEQLSLVEDPAKRSAAA